jgi:hypothetical protein
MVGNENPSPMVQELRIECMFPVDDATEANHARLLAGAPANKRPRAAESP